MLATTLGAMAISAMVIIVDKKICDAIEKHNTKEEKETEVEKKLREMCNAKAEEQRRKWANL